MCIKPEHLGDTCEEGAVDDVPPITKVKMEESSTLLYVLISVGVVAFLSIIGAIFFFRRKPTPASDVVNPPAFVVGQAVGSSAAEEKNSDAHV